jgi:hypothetical protein
MPPPKAAKKSKPEGVTLGLNVNGVDYLFSFADVTSRHELDLYKQSGLTMADLKEATRSGSFPRFALAAIMYLALRQADKGATYDKILAELDDDCHVEATTQDAKAPEA